MAPSSKMKRPSRAEEFFTVALGSSDPKYSPLDSRVDEEAALSDDTTILDDDSTTTLDVDNDNDIPYRSFLHLCGINAFAFSYGLLIATFGLVTLPLEAERLWPSKHALLLALFLAICGISQLSGPIAGHASDLYASKHGRRRPFMVVASCVGIPSLYMLRVASLAENLGLYLIFFLLAMLALNVQYVAYSGALTDLVNSQQRGFANGLMGAFTVAGASAGFGCFSYFDLNLAQGYVFYLIVLIVAVLISLVAYTETPTTCTTSGWTWQDIRSCYWVDPRQHVDFFLVFVSRTFYYMGISAQTFMLFYFRDVIGSTNPQSDVSYLALVGQLSGAVVCVPMGILSNTVGRKSLIYLSTIILVATYIAFYFCSSLASVLWVGVVYGMGNGTYLSVDYALACDTLPCPKQAARYLGIWGVGAFIGTLLGPLLIGPALLIFGDKGRVDENGTPMYELQGYGAILLIGCLCLIAGGVTVAPIKSAK